MICPSCGVGICHYEEVCVDGTDVAIEYFWHCKVCDWESYLYQIEGPESEVGNQEGAAED